MNTNILKILFGFAGETAEGEIPVGILTLTMPLLKNLIISRFVPILKRKMYEKIDNLINKLLKDLAQNASKIADEKSEAKKLAYTEGTRLGLDMVKAIAEKLLKAAEEIEGMI